MITGIYEQIINQLFEEKISSMDRTRFYIGERVIERKKGSSMLAFDLSITEKPHGQLIDFYSCQCF